MVTINDTFYKGKDVYSDGDIENEILDIFKKNKDINKILSKDNRWPILYHLSPERRNLLEWYPFKHDTRLLEIGAGCGAMTGLFCEKVSHVVAVELSRRRSEIIENRHKKFTNLEIFVGNFIDMKFNREFDYITLIGVLEYTRSFIKGKDPYSILFDKIKGMLKPDGKLFIAIENRLGLKYWAGAREDHTGNLFDGLYGYISGNDVETFSKNEIKNLLEANGFKNLKFYYPYPDYKLPTKVYSDRKLPDESSFTIATPNYDLERYSLFNEQMVYVSLIKNGLFDVFSNSFLIIASQ